MSRDDAGGEWPVALRGVTESVVATLGPNGRWNVAALGLHAPARSPGSEAAAGRDAVTARTWGRTRTRRNFERGPTAAHGDRAVDGVVQFTTDPREFVAAAVTVHEVDDPVLPGAAAWVDVAVERLAGGEAGGTEWVDWAVRPLASEVRERTVPTINRGFNAVIEATVAVSRLDVPGYDEAQLLDRLAHLASVVEAAGGPAERSAMATLDEETGWRDRR
ncbi:MAG: DUF447 domain-containing protein [Haloferacaceae archaeon]